AQLIDIGAHLGGRADDTSRRQTVVQRRTESTHKSRARGVIKGHDNVVAALDRYLEAKCSKRPWRGRFDWRKARLSATHGVLIGVSSASLQRSAAASTSARLSSRLSR